MAQLFFQLTLAVFDVSGRLAETGSGNQSPLVALESARLEQLGDMLLRFEAFILWHSFFSIDIGRVRRIVSPRRNRKRKSVSVGGV